MNILTVNLSRVQSRSVAVGALLLCFLSGLILLKSQSSRVVSIDLKNEELISLPSASTISLRNFHRSESKEGKLMWEIKALQGEYYPDKAEANLTEPTLKFFDKSGQAMELTAPKGRILFVGENLNSAYVGGGAKIVREDGLTVESEAFAYDKAVNQVTSPHHVVIKGDGFITSGEGLLIDSENHQTSIQKNVETIFSNKGKYSSGPKSKPKHHPIK